MKDEIGINLVVGLKTADMHKNILVGQNQNFLNQNVFTETNIHP